MTFQQVGVALGIAALGAWFQDRVASAFTSTPTGQLLGSAAKPLGNKIASGSLGSTPALPGQAAASLTDSVRTSFIGGLHDTLPIGAVLLGVATVVAIATIRRTDLHPSAMNATPGVPPEVSTEPASDATL